MKEEVASNEEEVASSENDVVSIEEIVRRLLDENNTQKVLKNSLKEVLPKKLELLVLIFFFIIASSFTYIFIENSYDAIKFAISTSNGTILVLFAVTFTAGALFVSLLNEKIIAFLLYATNEKKGRYKTPYSGFSWQFYGIIIIYIIIIAFNFLAQILLNYSSVIELCILVNPVVSSIFLALYCTVIIHILYETGCLAYNLYQILKLSVIGLKMKNMEGE
ncbi:MAG: hypothetical protein LBE57_00935 [Methanosarcinales archaeon]|jgi:hypothetical protein|nr:hypothetical protein [Methanosarcinales archaeon]